MSMQKYEINFKEEKVYIGIDVHKNQWHVCVRTADLSMKPFCQPPSAESLKKWLTTNFPGGTYISAYEVGFTGFSTHYALENVGIRNIVFNPGDINDSQKERSRKTDAVDCMKICRNLMNGELKPIYVPSLSELSGRGYLGARDTAVKKRQQSRQRIKSLLYRNGISYPKEYRESNKHWTRNFNSWLESLAAELGGGEGRRIQTFVPAGRHAFCPCTVSRSGKKNFVCHTPMPQRKIRTADDYPRDRATHGIENMPRTARYQLLQK